MYDVELAINSKPSICPPKNHLEVNLKDIHQIHMRNPQAIQIQFIQLKEGVGFPANFGQMFGTNKAVIVQSLFLFSHKKRTDKHLADISRYY